MRLKLSGNRREICELLACLCHGRRRRGLHDSRFRLNGFIFCAKGAQMATLTAKDTEVPGTCVYTFKFLDSKSKTAKVDTSQGLPTVVADNTSVVDSVGAVTDNGDGSFAATLHITDNLGASNLTVDGDADLGSGVTDVQFVDVVSVIPGDAVTGQGTFGPITPDA
jgi:hypothetical protein